MIKGYRFNQSSRVDLLKRDTSLLLSMGLCGLITAVKCHLVITMLLVFPILLFIKLSGAQWTVDRGGYGRRGTLW